MIGRQGTPTEAYMSRTDFLTAGLLTAAGRKQLAKELEQWDRLSSAIGLVVREAE